jgi:hypothetical protein
LRLYGPIEAFLDCQEHLDIDLEVFAIKEFSLNLTTLDGCRSQLGHEQHLHSHKQKVLLKTSSYQINIL